MSATAVASWRAALRIARRGAVRQKGRSALVVTMVGLPVAALAFGDVAFRTLDPSPAEQVVSWIGSGADAWVSAPSGLALVQTPPGADRGLSVGEPLPGPPPTVTELVPTATAVLELRVLPAGEVVPVTTDGRRAFPVLIELDSRDPLAEGILRQVSGRSPAGTSEVAVTPRVAAALAVAAGDEITVDRRTYAVVGVVERASDRRGSAVVGLPGAFPDVTFQDPESPGLDATGAGWLVRTAAPMTYRDTLAINALGSTVLARSVAADPPNSCSPEVPATVRMCRTGPEAAQLAEVGGLLALGIGMAALQVVLLVGPAFAIGRRRQAHDLALVAAAGGDARALRRVVLAGGVVLGVAGGVLGLLVGVVAFQLARPMVAAVAGGTLYGTDLRPELLLLPLVAVLTGTVAAWLPARVAARQDVVAALAGRRGEVRTRRTVPVVGLLALFGGGALAVFGAGPGEPALLLVGCLVAELGLVVLAPSIVGGLARLAPLLPTAPRLALRDAGRNRLRTGTAVAAVLAAVAGATALGVSVATNDAAAAAGHTPVVPLGYVAVLPATTEEPAPEAPAAAAALATWSGMERIVLVRGEAASVDELVAPRSTECTATDTVAANQWPCSTTAFGTWPSWVAATGPDFPEYQALTGAPPDESLADVLAGGGAVVAGDTANYVWPDGTVLLRAGDREVRLVAVEAPVEQVGGLPRFQLMVSAETFAALGRTSTDFGAVALTDGPPGPDEVAALSSALADAAPTFTVAVGEPYRASGTLPILLLLGAAVVLALAATVTAVGLANADARPDHATLAAVGAEPGTRRRISAATATIIAVLGTALGIVGGLVVGVAAVGGTTVDFAGATYGTAVPVAVPWRAIGATALLLPILAVGVAWVGTRSRVPMVRRVT